MASSNNSKVSLIKIRSLVNGYQIIRELEEQEKEVLQLFVEYAAIATSSWRFWKYNIDTPIAEKSDIHYEMVNISKDVRGVPEAEFIRAVFA